ncbi:MAG: WecB/TagA/CpsF family glycosyltransferase [Bacteroidetes bacterium]|nr:WecB/TagA/CpsF family glycosyltransferase [Bacteroidota bacterium]
MQKELISIKLNTGAYKSFVNEVVEMSETRSGYTCVANVHMLVEAYTNPSFARIVNDASMITPDGMPLTWGLKLLHGVTQDRVAGMDLLPDILREAQQKAIPVYFYGGTDAMLSQIEKYIPQHFPGLPIAGMYSPPFRPLSMEENELIAEIINSSGARIVFVILGCPKQEVWMNMMKNRIRATMIGVGGALPVMLGMQKRAPVWMQRAGLEWLFRLMQEPKRLFKRYAVTNSIFLLLLCKEFVRIRIFRQKPRFELRDFGK